MYGAILGDIIGSPYEFDENNIKTKDFPLFCKQSHFTDDSVMTIAVADALMKANTTEKFKLSKELIRSLKYYGRRYPDCGYGARFSQWLLTESPEPYHSFGNGSAMRVSAAAWMYESLEEVLEIAKVTAQITHDHPEGIKGAQATAAVIYMARHHQSKKKIKAYITKQFGYQLDLTCDEIRPHYHHVESCQETVPQAIIAFMEGTSFEDVIRTAISLGGDSDTLAAIAGSMAEGYYGVPDELKTECEQRLPGDLRKILKKFYKKYEVVKHDCR